MTKRIEHAIDVFLKAIEDGTLAKGNCFACAVGNLVSDGLGGEIHYDEEVGFECTVENGLWGKVFCTTNEKQRFSPWEMNKYIEIEIQSTGFSLEELMDIEYSFETNTQFKESDYLVLPPEEIRKDQIKGLESVVEVMMGFDDVKESVQEVFTSKADLIPV